MDVLNGATRMSRKWACDCSRRHCVPQKLHSAAGDCRTEVLASRTGAGIDGGHSFHARFRWMEMSLRSRLIAVSGGLASAVVIKWVFDRGLWDISFVGLFHLFDSDTAEPLTAVLSYLVPLTAGVAVHAALLPKQPEDDRAFLRKRPWQSRRIIAALLIIVAAIVAGLSYGRVFGLPSIALPQPR